MGLARMVGLAVDRFDRYLSTGLIVFVFCALLLQGRLTEQEWPSIFTALVLTVLMGRRVWDLATSKEVVVKGAYQKKYFVFQLELMGLCAIYFLFQLTGSDKSPLYPVLYVFLMAVGGFDSSIFNRVGVVVFTWLLEVFAFIALGDMPVFQLAVHFVVITAFPFVVGVLEWTWLQLERRKRDDQIQAIMQHADRQAEEYRFSGLTARDDNSYSEQTEQNRRRSLQRSSVKQLGISVANMLSVLEAALRPHTVAVYWLSVDGKTITLMDAICSNDRRLRSSMDVKEGILGAILARKNTMCRNHLARSERWFGYYAEEPPKLKSFIGVPLLETAEISSSENIEHLRGVLFADRIVDFPFGEDDERLMLVVGQEILRIWKTERQLNRMDVIKNEAQGLYDATEGLIKSVGLKKVINEVALSLRGIYPEADLVCVVLRNEDDASLVIEAAETSEKLAAWKREYLNQKLPKTHHLCDLAVRKGIIVPDAAFNKRIRSQRKIFGDKQDPPGLKSVKVAPLKLPTSHDENIGALVVGSMSVGFFKNRIGRFEDVKRTMETFSNIATISIQNAKRHERLQTMATTDGLTGLYNRRLFFEMLEYVLAESRRYNRPMSLILTDIDHFKKINDTYGHPKGDDVLRSVADVFREQARETDHVCRYGGEEFAVIMPQTDKIGAILLTERYRTEVNKQEFKHQTTLFNVSLSFGICTYPSSSSTSQELIQRADQALYRAKNSGRDRVVHYAD